MPAAVVSRVQHTPLANGDREAAAFHAAYPAYRDTSLLDELRATEYARLDAQGQVYLDYTGAGLYADSQVREHLQLLTLLPAARPVDGSPRLLNTLGG